jgi:hypothetical protein
MAVSLCLLAPTLAVGCGSAPLTIGANDAATDTASSPDTASLPDTSCAPIPCPSNAPWNAAACACVLPEAGSEAGTCPAGPSLGESCTAANLRCRYGYDPFVCGGRTVICQGGLWLEESHSDPQTGCFDAGSDGSAPDGKFTDSNVPDSSCAPIPCPLNAPWNATVCACVSADGGHGDAQAGCPATWQEALVRCGESCSTIGTSCGYPGAGDGTPDGGFGSAGQSCGTVGGGGTADAGATWICVL